MGMFGDAVTSSIGHLYDVALGELSQNASLKKPLYWNWTQHPPNLKHDLKTTNPNPPVGEPVHGLVIRLHAGAIYCDGNGSSHPGCLIQF